MPVGSWQQPWNSTDVARLGFTQARQQTVEVQSVICGVVVVYSRTSRPAELKTLLWFTAWLLYPYALTAVFLQGNPPPRAPVPPAFVLCAFTAHNCTTFIEQQFPVQRPNSGIPSPR